MSTRLVARNSVIMLGAQMVARIAGLATFVLLTRFLTAGEIGFFGYAVSLVGFLTLGVDFGFDLVVTRETARGKGGESAGLAMRLKTQMFAVCYPLVLAATYLLAGFGVVLLLVALLGAAVWHESINRTFGAYFLARGRAEYGFISELLTSLLRLGGIATVLLAGARLAGVGAVYVAGSAAAVCMLVAWAIRRGTRPVFATPAPGEARRVFAEASAFAVYALLFQIYFRIDVILLGVLRPATEVGHYVAAMRVVETTLAIPAVLTGALYPVLARLDGAGDRTGFNAMCAQVTRWLSVAGLGAALLFAVVPGLTIRLIAGPGYEPAAGYLRVLMVAFGLICLNCVGVLAINAVGRQRSNVWIMAAGAVAKVTWDLALIPAFGAMAACVGSVATEALVTACVVAAVRRWYAPGDWCRAWAGGALSAAATVAALMLTAALPMAARILVALVVFAAAALLTRAVRRGDFVVLRGLARPVPTSADAEVA